MSHYSLSLLRYVRSTGSDRSSHSLVLFRCSTELPVSRTEELCGKEIGVVFIPLSIDQFHLFVVVLFMIVVSDYE